MRLPTRQATMLKPYRAEQKRARCPRRLRALSWGSSALVGRRRKHRRRPLGTRPIFGSTLHTTCGSHWVAKAAQVEIHSGRVVTLPPILPPILRPGLPMASLPPLPPLSLLSLPLLSLLLSVLLLLLSVTPLSLPVLPAPASAGVALLSLPPTPPAAAGAATSSRSSLATGCRTAS